MAGSPFLRGFAILDMIYIYTYLEPVCPLFLAFPPKQGLFQSKQGSFEFQVFRYIHVPFEYGFKHHPWLAENEDVHPPFLPCDIGGASDLS